MTAASSDTALAQRAAGATHNSGGFSPPDARPYATANRITNRIEPDLLPKTRRGPRSITEAIASDPATTEGGIA